MAQAALLPRTDTRARILDAAFEAIRSFGLARTTVEDVAQRAGLSRQTVYRYFPSKDHLVVALVFREEERFLDGVREAFAAEPDLTAAIERAVRFVLAQAREHPLLDRLLHTDEPVVLPYLTTRGLPVITRARDVMVELVAARVDPVDLEALEGCLDAAVRATLSYILTPSELPPAAVARTLARTVVRALPREASR